MRLPRKHEIPLVILTYQMTCCSGFFATRENIRPLKPRQDEKPHRMFCQKEVYRDSKRYTGIPLLVVVPSIAYFRLIYRKLAENPRYTFGSFEKRHNVFARNRYTVTLSVSPSWYCCALNTWFFVQCTLNWQNIPVYRCVAFFNQHRQVWSFAYTHPRQT